MNGSSFIDSELLARYLVGEADDAQRRAVEEWAGADTANAAELERMRRIWDDGASGAVPDVDVGTAIDVKRLGGDLLDLVPAHEHIGWGGQRARLAVEDVYILE